MPPGSRLESEAALMARFGVSRVTVRQAIALLARTCLGLLNFLLRCQEHFLRRQLANHPLDLRPQFEDEFKALLREAVLRYRHFLHYAEGSMMPPLLLSLVFARVKQAPMPFFAKPIAIQ